MSAPAEPLLRLDDYVTGEMPDAEAAALEEELFAAAADADPSASAFTTAGLAADAGFLVLLITILLAGLGMRQLRKTGGTANVFGRVATPLATILLVAYLIAVWAMTTKPD